MIAIMIIKNVMAFQENATFLKTDIFTSSDYFSNTSVDNSIIDGTGLYAIPGLIDIHFHGCDGSDFCDGSIEAIKNIASYELKNGVTTIVPATMTLSENDLTKICSTAAEFHEFQQCNDEPLALLEGINLEGPFISLEQKGAQNLEYIHAPNIEMYHKLQKASHNLIKLVDIAPETEFALDFIDRVKNEVHISLAHTTADYGLAKTAFDHGASQVTHLFNAMPQFMHRFPGVIGAAFDSPHTFVELICDGVHIHPSTVRVTFQIFTDDRIILISDSMRATGKPSGKYSLGGQDVFVKGNLATLKDGTIAGSATNLMNCLRIAVKEMGIPFASAVKCATQNPAKAIGLYDKYGSISSGKIANLVLLDKDLNIRSIILKGRQISF